MTMKPFEIQSPSLSINGVLIDTSVNGNLVLPGVTRAASSVAIEVEDTQDQSQSWNSTPLVIDGYTYEVNYNGYSQQIVGWTAAEYAVEELDDDGYIDGINVTNGGAGYTGEAVTFSTVMYASEDGSNWTQIPFRVRCGAGEIESVFGGGGGGASALDQLEDTDISDPQNGQALVWNDDDGVWKNQTVQGGGTVNRARGPSSTAYTIASSNENDNTFTVEGDASGEYGEGDLVWSSASPQFVPQYFFTVNSVEYDEGLNQTVISLDDDIGGTTYSGSNLHTVITFENFTEILPGENITMDFINQSLVINTTGNGGSGASVTTSDFAPISPNEGDLWFDTEGGQLYVYFDSVWVDASPSSSGGGSASTGNVTFDDVAVQGTGTLKLSPSPSDTGTGKFLQVRAGENDSHIHFDSGDNSTYDLILGDDSKYVQVDHTGNILLQTNDNNGTIASWTFDYAGSLTLPDGGKIEPVGMGWTGITNGTTNHPVSIINKKADDGTALSSIQLDSNSVSGSVNINVKDTVDGAPTDQNWYFWADGKFQLPPGGDIVDSDYNSVLGGGSGGTSLPSDATGYLRNDGSGTLTWNTNTVTAGSPSYSDVWVTSAKADNFWSSYSLTGNITMLFNYGQPVADITLTNQAVSGKQFNSGDKILIVNDTSSLNSNSYGLVVEFPASPTVGDTFSTPLICPTATQTISVTQMQAGHIYTIVSIGDTAWNTVGVYSPSVGQQFQFNGGSVSGTGTVSTSGLIGVSKIIFKPASGQRLVSYNMGIQSSGVSAGEGTNNVACYNDLTSGAGNQAITWVYAGVIDTIPTWYQMYF